MCAPASPARYSVPAGGQVTRTRPPEFHQQFKNAVHTLTVAAETPAASFVTAHRLIRAVRRAPTSCRAVAWHTAATANASRNLKPQPPRNDAIQGKYCDRRTHRRKHRRANLWSARMLFQNSAGISWILKLPAIRSVVEFAGFYSI